MTKEDIFYYVYGFLHLPGYKQQFAADLKKALPRIMLTEETKIFWQIVKAGRKLVDLHLNYERQTSAEGALPFDEVKVMGIEAGDFRVEKLRYGKADKSEIIYNSHIRIKDIPVRAFYYEVNGKSPLDWVIDRYKITVDKESKIENDPNKWCEEQKNPRYILDLILSLIHMSIQTAEIVDSLPEVDFAK